MARMEPIADDSLPDMRARSNPGTAMAAMMPMIATTISSSMSVKPFWLRTFMTVSSVNSMAAWTVGLVGPQSSPAADARHLATAVPAQQNTFSWRLNALRV